MKDNDEGWIEIPRRSRRSRRILEKELTLIEARVSRAYRINGRAPEYGPIEARLTRLEEELTRPAPSRPGPVTKAAALATIASGIIAVLVYADKTSSVSSSKGPTFFILIVPEHSGYSEAPAAGELPAVRFRRDQPAPEEEPK